jgi:hypothetical protein
MAKYKKYEYVFLGYSLEDVATLKHGRKISENLTTLV